MIYIQRDEYENGKHYFDEGMHIELFDDEIEICSDVKAVKVGGHSIGSSIVEIINDDKTYIISGDECYIRECLDKKIPTGSSYCTKKSCEFINKYSDKKYDVLLCHDV